MSEENKFNRWFIDELDDDDEYCPIFDTNGDEVCVVYPGCVRHDMIDLSNARLIAATPRLEKALATKSPKDLAAAVRIAGGIGLVYTSGIWTVGDYDSSFDQYQIIGSDNESVCTFNGNPDMALMKRVANCPLIFEECKLLILEKCKSLLDKKGEYDTD